MVVETALYDTLEVEVTASDTEIRKSYRRLALLHHPDKPTGDPQKFQAIQSAWEILGDSEKRADYDRFGSESSRRGGMSGMDGEDLFESMFGMGMGGMGGMGAGRQKKRQARESRPSFVTLNVGLEEVYKGADKHLMVERSRKCTTCKGSGGKPKAKKKPCVKCGGQGVVIGMQRMGPFMTRAPMECDACDGEGQKFKAQDSCKKCSGTQVVNEKKRVDFHIIRGMHDGEVVILRGEGDENAEAASPGDLHIAISITPHSTFSLLSSISKSQPANLRTKLSITLSESLLGFSRLSLLHLDGRGLKIVQPPPGKRGWRTFKSGDEVLVKGEGMWRKGMKGDLVVEVVVEMPDKGWADGLDADKIKALEALLPPRRPDIAGNVPEVDEVELEAYDPKSQASGSSSRRATEEDEEYETEEEEGGGGCHHQ